LLRQAIAGDTRAAVLFLKRPARDNVLLFSRSCRERERKALCCEFESAKRGHIFHIVFF
jgi:hypothetical protein